jgi:hypothetical protein
MDIMAMRLRLCLTWLLFFYAVLVSGQVTTIEGYVRELGTNESIPFAHVFLKGLQIGTTTDTTGYYKLQFELKGRKADSVTFTFLGYLTERATFTPNVSQKLDVYLKPQFTSLGAVTFKAEENPAWPLLERVIKQKEKNNPEAKESYSCEEYSKIRFDLNNFTEKIKENFLVRPFEFLWDDVDSTADGIPFLPVLLVEKSIEHYFQNSPKRQRDVVTGINTTGLRGTQIMRFVEDLYLNPNVYDDFVIILDKSFPSPITRNFKLFYDHYLMDSSEVDGRKTYRLMFEPKHKRELAFTGEMLIDAQTLALRKIEVRFDIMANVNFIRSYWVSQRYEPVAGDHWMLAETQVLGDFTVIENNAEMTGFFGRKSSVYRDYQVNTKIPSTVFKGSEVVVEADSAQLRDQLYWQSKRNTELTEQETGIYDMVKKIEKDPAFILRKNLILAFVTGYVPIKTFDIGSFYSFYSYNVIEHSRVKLGFRTGKKFDSPLRFSGYGAYGFYDEKWKYGGAVDWNLSYRKKNPNRIGVSYKNDIEQLGRSFNQLEIDHVLTSFVQIGAVTSRNYITDANAFFESNVTTGLLAKVNYFNQTAQRTQNEYFGTVENGVSIPTEKFSVQGFNFLLKFSYQNKGIKGQYYSDDDTKLTYRKYPDLAFEVRRADKRLGSDLDFTKVNFQMKQNVRMRALGYWQYYIDVGKTFGAVPYPYLNIPFGNQLVFQDDYAFNLMNFLEYVSDEYATVYVQHHLGGLLLDRIPLINKLKWRTFTFARAYWGTLSEKNNQSAYLFPENLRAINNSYYEVGFGIENIFKISRIDFTWRLTDTDVPSTYFFIVKPSFRFSF